MVAGYLSRNYDQASQAAHHLMQTKQCATQSLLTVVTLHNDKLTVCGHLHLHQT